MYNKEVELNMFMGVFNPTICHRL